MTANADEFEIRGKDAEGKGVFTDRGFLVKEGSLARREIVPSAQSSVPAVHQRLISEGVVEEHGEHLRFVKDHLFDSPSGAAAAVLGRTANGWKEWKRADGQTLSKVKRVSRDDESPLLDEANRKQIIERHEQLQDEGKLRTKQQLDEEYSLFRERFGPSVLQGLDGDALLTRMHDHSNRDSLVYWLEFKNDDEFETRDYVVSIQPMGTRKGKQAMNEDVVSITLSEWETLSPKTCDELAGLYLESSPSSQRVSILVKFVCDQSI